MSTSRRYSYIIAQTIGGEDWFAMLNTGPSAYFRLTGFGPSPEDALVDLMEQVRKEEQRGEEEPQVEQG